jgi:hypothetical protein
MRDVHNYGNAAGSRRAAGVDDGTLRSSVQATKFAGAAE